MNPMQVLQLCSALPTFAFTSKATAVGSADFRISSMQQPTFEHANIIQMF
jgi:hypothetical protein